MSNTSTKQGFATIKCAYQPKEGRSGGGLYTTDGYVAGVCDFADPNEHVGLYAVPEAIHRLLDRNQLTALYKPSTNGGDACSRRTGPGPRPRPARIPGPERSPDESANPDAVTLPPPSMVGDRRPPSDARRSGRSEKPAPRRPGRPVSLKSP